MEPYLIFLVLGGLLLIGLATDEIGRRTRLPRVTLLILFGVTIGPSGLDWLPTAFQGWYEFLASAALTMVAFLLGGRLSADLLRRHGAAILSVSIAVVVSTVAVVGLGLVLIGIPVEMALLLAGIATATDPAAVQDVVRQVQARGPFTETLLGVVAVDDAWGLIAFSFLLVFATAAVGNGSVFILQNALLDIAGAVAVGLAVGAPAAFLTGRLQPGEPVLTEALGVVFLCAGFAIYFNVSFLLAGMIAGAVVVNFAEHHNRPFHEIEHIEWPFMVFFFVLAGASLHLESLSGVALAAVAYVALRLIGRFCGGWIGGRIGGTPQQHRRWFGAALVPQAGVAVGMALVAFDQFPEIARQVLAITISTTILFEMIGPILTLSALRRAGEAAGASRDATNVDY